MKREFLRYRPRPASVDRSARWARRRLAAVAVVLVAALLAVAPASTAKPAARSEAAIPRGLQTAVDRLIKLGAPGALVLVDQGEERWIGVAGLADLATRRPVAAGDTWRIASVTKIVTALVVLQLERERRLALNDRLSKHLPKAPARFRKTTIRQLLLHTGGVPDYLKHASEPLQISARALQASLGRQRSADARVALAASMKDDGWIPNEHQYSNSNYILLEQIVEAVTGQQFEQVVTTRVIEPLGLSATGFPDARGRLARAHLRGYVSRDGKAGPFTDRTRSIDVTEHVVLGKADGSLVSGAIDLSMLLDAVATGRLLGGRKAADLVRDAVSDHDGFYRYGPGLMVLKTRCGRQIFGHDGRDLGVYTRAFADPANGRRLVLVVNTALDRTGLEQAIDQLQNDVFCG